MSDETAQTANTAQTTDSAPADVPSEAPQAPTSEVTPPLAKDDNLAQNVPESQPIETPQMAQTGENPPALEQKPEPSLTPETPPTSPETGTAQTPVNEPLPAQPEPITQNKSSLARQLLISARNAIQFRKERNLIELCLCSCNILKSLTMKSRNFFTSRMQLQHDISQS